MPYCPKKRCKGHGILVPGFIEQKENGHYETYACQQCANIFYKYIKYKKNNEPNSAGAMPAK
jgi:hypothetical protein